MILTVIIGRDVTWHGLAKSLTSPMSTRPHPQEPEPEEEGGGGNGVGEAFDFEAHMARLIERSERSLGFAAARGWEEGELEKLERVREGVVC